MSSPNKNLARIGILIVPRQILDLAKLIFSLARLCETLFSKQIIFKDGHSATNVLKGRSKYKYESNRFVNKPKPCENKQIQRIYVPRLLKIFQTRASVSETEECSPKMRSSGRVMLVKE